MTEIMAIDTMNRPTFADPSLAKEKFETFEYKTMAQTTFGGLKERLDIQSEDEYWKVLSLNGHDSVEAGVQTMDEVGVEKVFMDQAMLWSRREKRLITTASISLLEKMAEESNGRIVPGVGYNPHRIQESLDRIDQAASKGFKYVWFHPMSFGMRPSDRRCYPLYSKCLELDLPVCFQTGQSAEPLPSEPGHPMYADEVAMDFPNLTIVLTHTGWPWTEEWCSMLWRHPKVYGNIGAYYPSFLPDEQVEFIDSGRLRDKVFWATNGLDIKRCKQEFLDLPIGDDTRRKVLRENALEVFDI
jgi:predicted TIM-barrel fold metal-dependent hydrolase